MTILSIQDFAGEMPRIPAHLLPDNAAKEAVNCNISHGELRSMAGPSAKISTTQAVRALFTDNGLRFFTWPIPTRAYLSPTIDDTHERVYFANANGFRVAQASQMKLANLNPGQPTASWVVGVARPSAAPTLELRDSLTWKTDPAATAEIKLFWEADGQRGSELNVTQTTVVKPWREYLLTVSGVKLPTDGTGAVSGESVGKVHVQAIRYQSIVDDASNGGTKFGPEVEVPINGNVALTGTKVRVEASGAIYPQSGFSGGQVTLIKKNDFWFTYAQLYANLQSGEPIVAPGTEAPTNTLAVEFRVVGPNAVRHLTMFSANSALESTGETRAAVIGEQVSDTQYRVRINYDPVETVAYVTTFQNDWGEESAPSDPVLIDIDPVQNVFISQTYAPLAGGRPVAGMNVYRTFRANQSADFILLNPVPLTTMEAGKYVALDGHPRPPSTTVLQTTEWDPPSASLGNLTYAGNGFFVGSRGKDLVFSEPYRPHAWPYAMTFPHGIVAIVAVEGGLLVTTQAQPYVVYGSHPAQMSQQLLNTEQAGIAGRSITTVEGAAIYASHDGLVTVRGGQASLKSSQELFTRKDWRDRYKSVLHNLILCAHDGAVVGLVDPSHPLSVGSATPGFQIRLDEAAQGQYVGVRLDESPIGAFVSSTTDTLFVGYTNGFAEWATGSDLEAMWHSKDFTYPKPEFFSAAKVRGWGAWEVSIYADGEPVTSQMIEFDGIDAFGAEKSFRLPAVGTHTRWSVVFIGRGRIRSFEMGASFAELRHV